MSKQVEEDLKWIFGAKTVNKQKSRGKGNLSKNQIKKQILQINLKNNPVILKITSHTHVKNGGVKAHLNYLSRESKDEDGEISDYDLLDQYGNSMGEREIDSFHETTMLKAKAFGKKEEKRVTTNLMITKPHLMSSTDFKQAGEEWLKINFPDYDYAYVFHNDSTEHMHASIGYYNDRGVPLNPRKSNIQEWRDSFAEIVNEKSDFPIVNSLSANTKGKLKNGYRRDIEEAKKRGQGKYKEDKNKKELSEERQKKIINSKRNALLRLYYYAKNEEKDVDMTEHLKTQLSEFDKNNGTGFKVKRKTAQKGGEIEK